MEEPLSQTPKKPGGARDISDLKARLGLKKGGGPAAAPPGARPKSTTGSAPPPSGGAIPPPMGARAAAVPAPPGVRPPPGAAPPRQEPAVVIPDAKQDPFGAMSAMAAASTATAAPDFVIVNDGAPIEAVGKETSGARWAKLTGMFLVPLVVGVIIGQIGSGAKIYNKTIDSATQINEQVRKVNKDLQTLRDLLYTHKIHGANNAGYKLADAELTAALEEFYKTLEMPNMEVVFESYLYEMDAATVGQTLSFFTDYKNLYLEVKDHAEKAKNDAKALEFAEERARTIGGPSRFAVYIELPKQGDDSAPITTHFVELGDPICANGNPNPAGCDGQPQGFMYRPDETGPWGKMELATKSNLGVKRLMPLGFTSSPVMNNLFTGGGPSYAAVGYDRRITDIDARVDDLMNRGKELQKALTSTASKGKKFTFFQ